MVIKHNSLEPVDAAWVFDMKSRRSQKRMALPQARVSDIGEVSFVSNDLIRYAVDTLTRLSENDRLRTMLLTRYSLGIITSVPDSVCKTQ